MRNPSFGLAVTVIFLCGCARKPAAVLINGATLTREQAQEVKTTYGMEPQAGEWWYDARSGLYGKTGGGALGFMRPGHSFGRMSRDASGGDTGVVVNGRELPKEEWLVWSGILGAPIMQGAYWFDANGNAGYEGSPVVTANLYLAAQQTAYRTSGGGDNFWSSRFSAGNSNAGNTQGYVSVPGHGPVGYGF